MEGIEIQSLKMSFLLATSLVMVSFILVAAEDVVPLPPLPAPDHDYLENCGTKLHPKCGEEVKAAVYTIGKISDECCKDIVAEGRACHDKFVQVTTPYYPELARSDAPAKAAQAWNHCSAVVSKK